jgi:hypothetical protein
MILQIATALAIGAYAVLSKDTQPKRPDAKAPRAECAYVRWPLVRQMDANQKGPH